PGEVHAGSVRQRGFGSEGGPGPRERRQLSPCADRARRQAAGQRPRVSLFLAGRRNGARRGPDRPEGGRRAAQRPRESTHRSREDPAWQGGSGRARHRGRLRGEAGPMKTRGFTLLEVLVAIAILGLGLTAILSAQTGLFASSMYAEHVSSSIGLLRCR